MRALFAFGLVMVTRDDLLEAFGAALFCCTLLPLLVLKFKRSRRQKKFGAQFPDALDIIVRSLRAGHPVPIAITMVAREMADPIGTEFGIVADEITYGADLETGMRNLYFRIGQDDLPLFVTAVAIQSSTGGNLGEILENLSAVIRQRFKMRRKIRALASEGRASAMILSSLPILMFLVIQVITPDFYASVWHEDLTKMCLAARRRLDADRQFHHVPHGQLQDLTDGHARPAAERRQHHHGRGAGVPCRRHAGVLHHGGRARAGLGQAPRRQHRPGRRHRTAPAATARCGIRA